MEGLVRYRRADTGRVGISHEMPHAGRSPSETADQKAAVAGSYRRGRIMQPGKRILGDRGALRACRLRTELVRALIGRRSEFAKRYYYYFQ